MNKTKPKAKTSHRLSAKEIVASLKKKEQTAAVKALIATVVKAASTNEVVSKGGPGKGKRRKGGGKYRKGSGNGLSHRDDMDQRQLDQAREDELDDAWDAAHSGEFNHPLMTRRHSKYSKRNKKAQQLGPIMPQNLSKEDQDEILNDFREHKRNKRRDAEHTKPHDTDELRTEKRQKKKRSGPAQNGGSPKSTNPHPDDWWNDLSREDKEAYMKAHPKSHKKV